MLRRRAQENRAATNLTTPRKNQETETDSSPPSSTHSHSRPSTPNANPKTPIRNSRVSIGAYRSPVQAPSRSATIPFDWEAARSLAPPPYGTPLGRKMRKSMATSTDSPMTERRTMKRVVRKKSLFQRISDIPSNIAFHISMFPQNIPLPSPKTSSRILAGTLHTAQFFVRFTRTRRAPDWEDIYVEEEMDTWWDWTTLLTILLVSAAFANAAYLFSRTRKYHFHRRADPIASPNAKFVSKDWDQPHQLRRSYFKITFTFIWWAFTSFWRFLLNMSPPVPTAKNPTPQSRVQELEVWSPGELELQLFSLYSPVHALLWLATAGTNWIMMLFSMGLLTITLNVLIFTYQTLIKDKETIAAEVMNEYNQGFVYPRVNPIRHDKGVMTHESEIVDY